MASYLLAYTTIEQTPLPSLLPTSGVEDPDAHQDSTALFKKTPLAPMLAPAMPKTATKQTCKH